MKQLYQGNSSDQKTKAEKAKDISNSIYNVKFALSLAVLCDVYQVFSQISVLLQKVSCLPHSRYDQFKDLLADYEDMIEHVDIRSCPCSTFRSIEAGDYSIASKSREDAREVCSWPTFHTDIETLKETGKIVHVLQGQLVTDPIKDTRIGRKNRAAIRLLNEDDIIEVVQKRGRDIVSHLSSRLEQKVYRVEDIKAIKNSRVLLGARDLLLSVKSKGAATIANLTCERFLKSAVEVDNRLLERIEEEAFKTQYREYLRRLESLAITVPGVRDMSDMDLLELFLKPENTQLYEGAETVMSVMVRAALMISVESVVESWISVMEHHASQRRTLGEMLLHEEMVIAVNGPSMVHCDSIVQVTY